MSKKMNYDIRKICTYFPKIHSRYYVDTNGCFYTSLSENTHRILIQGVKHNINGMKKSLLSSLNNTCKQITLLPIKNNKTYFLLNNGVVLQRLQTKICKNGRISVCLIKIGNSDRGTHIEVHRILAGCFIGSVEGKEVHHIDKNYTNNSIDNLEILSFEEHRSKEGIHSCMSCIDYSSEGK